jgi:hypothetical protein
MSYQQAIFLETHKTKANTGEWFSFKIERNLKQKLFSSLEFVLTGIMLKTYMTMSYLWLWNHQFNEFSKKLKKQRHTSLPRITGYIKPRLS